MFSTRKKSCNACVSSKRRCDLGLPFCGRCLSRGVNCVYPWATTEAFTSAEASNAGVSLVPVTNGLLEHSPRYQDASWMPGAATDMTNYLHVPYTASSPSSVPAPLSPAMESLISDIINRTGTCSPLGLNFTPGTPGSGAMGVPEVAEDYDGQVATGSRFQPRTEYAGRRLAAQACVLVQSGQTAFIHRTHVGASAVLQDALAASALHAMLNPANSKIVRAEISRRCNLLVGAVEAVLACSPPVEIDLLPPVQALLVYQCIRLFSILDITQQAQAERDGVRLAEWVQRLRQQIRPLEPTEDWADWVRQESVRRTVVFAEMVSGVYTFLRHGWDSAGAKVAHLGFTAQAALWEAESEVEWRRAWATSRRLEHTVNSFTHDVIDANPDDLDELGILLRAMCRGLEKLEEWMCGDRMVLIRWGLRDEQPLPSY
ncbi:fungal zn(2)-Cys(6) binuclear cluster domain-containing [Fusarium albosuccineum]|uniref:Fungal zn(2)-Cys(6) binuclear cluster domain-containing n=1 Tax=Fusarium albosuccineum TaxID=1237068 RepID=A0A8H4LQM1_9HYPO|nr:fungal zn(2)-Cys(6) binuclear cluster domain-containing [Fusarium albosuccineum]